MSDQNIDSLSVRISADTSQAERGINNLASRLNELSAKFENLANMANTVSNALNNAGQGANSAAEQSEKAGGKIQAVIDALKQGVTDLASKLKSKFGNLTRSTNSVSDAMKNTTRNANDAANAVSQAMKGENASAEVTQLKNRLEELNFELKTYNKTIENAKAAGRSFNVPMERAEEAKAEIESVTAKLAELEQASANTDATPQADGETASQVERVQEALEEGAKSGNRFREALSNAFNTARRAASKFGSVIPVVGRGVREMASLMTSAPRWLGGQFKGAMETATGALTGFLNRVKRMMITRAIRAAIRLIINGIKEGTENAYQYSKLISGDLSKSMDRIATAGLYLKNSLGAMAAPIINAVAPALDGLVDRFVAIINQVNLFIAKLTGAKTYMVAKKFSTEWKEAEKTTRKSTKKIQDEIKRTVLGFDELNIMQKQTDSDSGSDSDSDSDSTNYGLMFDTKAVGDSFSDIQEKIQNVMGTIKSAWEAYGKPMVEQAKAALESVKGVIEVIGDTFYQVFTNGYGFEWLGSLFQQLQATLAIIQAIAVAFKTAWTTDNTGLVFVESIFGMLTNINLLIVSIKTAFAEAWNASGIGVSIMTNLLNIVTGMNNIVANLTASFTGAWEEGHRGEIIFENIFMLVDTILSYFRQIVDTTAEWAANLDFGPILDAFNGLLEALKPVADLVGGALAWAWENVLLPLGKWTIEAAVPVVLGLLSAALGVLTAIITPLQGPAQWLWENFLQPLGQWTGDIIIGALTLLKDGLNALKEAIEAADLPGKWAAIQEKLDGLIEKIIGDGGIIESFTTLKDKIGEVLEPAITAMGKAWNWLKEHALGPLVTWLGDTFFKAIEGIATALGAVLDFINDVFKGDWQSAWEDLVKLVATPFNTLGTILKTPVNAVIKLLNSMIGKVESAINKVVNGINNHLRIHIDPISVWPIGQVFAGLDWGAHLATVSWGRISELAEGGILTQPTFLNMHTIAGEAGREAVLPLDQNTEWMDMLAERLGEYLLAPSYEGNAEVVVQNADSEQELSLLREQNRLLQQLLDKDTTIELGTTQITNAYRRMSYKTGIAMSAT